MVRINGGTFIMGSPANEPERDNGELQHQVTVGSYYIEKCQVTQRQYQEVMTTNPSNLRWDSLPVENVSWYDALVYCNRLSVKEKLDPAYQINGSTDPAAWDIVSKAWNAVQIVPGSNGYRLPTEAQWEYACRAGTTTPFSNGRNITTNQANYDGNYPYNNNAKGDFRRKTMPVGGFAPNPWGLYDMHGNVFEWCWDWYGTYPRESQADPQGASSGTYRILRGGSWFAGAKKLRSAFRHYDIPSDKNEYIGFRVVRPIINK